MEIFSPSSTSSINASAVTANVFLEGGAAKSMRVAVSGSDVVFVSFGDASVEASIDTGVPVFPNAPEVFRMVSPYPKYAAAITVSGNSRVSFTTGEGL